MKPPIKLFFVLTLLLAAALPTPAQPAADQSIRQTAFYQQVMDSLRVAGLNSSWLTSTNTPLMFGADNTVIGPTTTNTLTFSNNVEVTGRLTATDFYPDNIFSKAQILNLTTTNEEVSIGIGEFGDEVTPDPAISLYAPSGRVTIEATIVEIKGQMVFSNTATNGPSNTTNAARWISVLEGTNAYWLPIYQ
jgi:hypothetical protein